MKRNGEAFELCGDGQCRCARLAVKATLLRQIREQLAACSTGVDMPLDLGALGRSQRAVEHAEGLIFIDVLRERVHGVLSFVTRALGPASPCVRRSRDDLAGAADVLRSLPRRLLDVDLVAVFYVEWIHESEVQIGDRNLSDRNEVPVVRTTVSLYNREGARVVHARVGRYGTGTYPPRDPVTSELLERFSIATEESLRGLSE